MAADKTRERIMMLLLLLTAVVFENYESSIHRHLGCSHRSYESACYSVGELVVAISYRRIPLQAQNAIPVSVAPL